MNALDELRQVMPPSKRPLYADGDWKAVEAAIGLRLPADYKALLGTYGSGSFCCIDIPSPLRPGEDVRRWWTSWAQFYPDIAEFVETPYPVFPEPGGLLPFGSLGDVDILNWLTVGEPEEWPFVYYDREKGFFEIKGLSCVEFILEAVTQRSPLLTRLQSVSVFDPPRDFFPHPEIYRVVRLFNPRSLELDLLAQQLAKHLPDEDVRVRRKAGRITLLVDSWRGDITFFQEEDGRTFCSISYDMSCIPDVEGLVDELLETGFIETGRS